MAKKRDNKPDDSDEIPKGKTPPPDEDLDALDEIFKDEVNLDDDAVEIVDDEGAVEIVDEDEAEPVAPMVSPKNKPPKPIADEIEEAEEVLDAVEATADEDAEDLDDIFTDAEETEEVAEVEEAEEVAEIEEAVEDAEEAVEVAEDSVLEDEAEPVGGAKAAADEDAFVDEMLLDETPVTAAKGETEEAADLDELAEAVEEAEEVAEVEEAEEVVEEAEPVAKAVSEDEVDLNEIFGETEDEAEEVAEVEEAAEVVEEAEPVAKAVSEDDVDLGEIFAETDDEEAAEVAEVEEEVAEVTEEEPVATPVSEDDVNLSELFGEDEKSEAAKETVGEMEMEEEPEPVAAKGAFDEEEETEVAEIEEDEEEGELVGAGAPSKGKAGRGEAKSGGMGRWAGGLALGLLVGVGSVGATWYLKPELLGGNAEEPAPKQVITAKSVPAMDDPEVKALVQKLEGEKQALQNSQAPLAKQLQDAQQREKKLQADLAAASKGGADPALIAKLDTERKKAEAERDQLVKTLVDAKLVEAAGKADAAAIAKSVKELADAKTVLAVVNKRLKEANVAELNEKGVDSLVNALKDAEKKVTDVDQALADAKVKDLQDLVDARKRLETERNELDTAIKAAFKELASANLVAPGGDPRKELIAGIKAARERADAKPAGPLTQLEQKLDLWLTVLSDPSRNDAAELAVASREAALLQSPKSNAETRAKAMAVSGLVHRNQGRFADALQAMQAASNEAQANKLAGPWTARLAQTVRELADPAAYFMPRVEQFTSVGNVQGALNEINAALKALPGDGRLLALRSQLRLDVAGGKVSDALKAQIRQDLDAAQKDPRAAAETAYAHGRLQELDGNLAQAETAYRQALRVHKGSADESARYRIALARLLQRERTFGGDVIAPPPRKIEPEPKKDAEGPKIGRLDESLLRALLTLALVGVQGGDEALDPAAAARLQESIELAKELIKSSDPKVRAEGHKVLGAGLAKQGRRTEGLKEYIRGLEILTPGASSQELSKMVENHPAFQQPDTLARPNPALAEYHFGRGLHFYWSAQLSRAEEHFKQAVSYYKEDARYQYFLGLSQLGQQTKLKRDAAYHAFEQGARLEAMNRPPHSDINVSLERLQGELRQVLNSFRHKR